MTAIQEVISVLRQEAENYLFEVSWEVCNKVGGIYTVLRSKLPTAIKNFGANNYILIGPLVERNRHFIEANTAPLVAIAEVLQAKNLNCKVGYWDTEGKPIVILIDFRNRYRIDTLLYNLWADFKVDSLASNYDYQEPILFATAAGEVIEALANSNIMKKHPVIAHFHEWLCGAGLLYLKKHCGEVSTVFTTHATVLGRSLASNGISIYNLPKTFDATLEAKKYGVFAKHSLEGAAAKAAHCFTTVSAITADEAYIILGKYPDKVVFNGLDIEKKQISSITTTIATPTATPANVSNVSIIATSTAPATTLATATTATATTTATTATATNAIVNANAVTNTTVITATTEETTRAAIRRKLRDIASRVIGKILPENTLLCLTSGRYEFHNKGFDVLLQSLAQLEKKQSLDAPPLVVFFLVAADWHTKQDSLLEGNAANDIEQKSAIGIATHHIFKPEQDSIIRACNELGLKQGDHKTHVVFCDAYLNGSDGVFDIVYEQVLAACDFSIFPSFYEPWGYTPLESIADSTPTITTDLAGFGDWVHSLAADYKDAVYVLERKHKTDSEFVDMLSGCLEEIIKHSQDSTINAARRKKAFAVASLADWKYFYMEYLDAYFQAMKFNDMYHNRLATTMIVDDKTVTAIYEAESSQPRFRTFQYDSPLPEKLNALRELAYNFWWSWHESAKGVFARINQALWEEVGHNPVHFLNHVTNADLQKAAANEEYMRFYEKNIAAFCMYCKDPEAVAKFCNASAISDEHPIAYFCMEYGINECLPIYSGGLGILAGDYLKAMSDLKIPLVAIGLFYKQGYFLQNINAHGEQIAIYKTWNDNQIPVRTVRDTNGKPLLVGVEILGRTVYAKVWVAKVGHIKLYLMDTDVIENATEDREITNSLYGGSSEVRIKQEIILGIGGVKLILEKLNIQPSLYHLNEGHSAFLLLERIHNCYRQGFSLAESMELIRCTSIFTTHTPVAAGNEEFSEELIRKYFIHYIGSMEAMGVSLNALLNFANSGITATRSFSMTALALRLCSYSNAVSTLHGKVARTMWQSIWSELLPDEVPITHVTNGVHLGSWLGNSMKLIYHKHLKPDWQNKQDDRQMFDSILTISDEAIWQAHQTQKNKLIELAKNLVLQQYSARNENKQLLKASLDCLKENVLLLGLARRFTAYKRNDLILKDRERLARILTNESRPIVMLVAGKAHPADGSGSDLIRTFIDIMREPRFNGHIIFLEEYNIALAEALVQGVDVWINTPLVGREACGTSGMKVGVNGGLNFSTKDGWWEEACSNPQAGWVINSVTAIADSARRNDIENMFMLNILENEIAPLYYNKNRDGFNPGWVSKMKASIALVAGQYNTSRMVKDYIEQLYCPAIKYATQLFANDYQELKNIVRWKSEMTSKFNTVKIKAILAEGIKEGKIVSQGLITVRLLLFAGKLSANELRAELVLKKTDDTGDATTANKPQVIPFTLTDSREAGVLSYIVEHRINDTGFYSYGVRVFPYNEKLLRPQDARMVYWG